MDGITEEFHSSVCETNIALDKKKSSGVEETTVSNVRTEKGVCMRSNED